MKNKFFIDTLKNIFSIEDLRKRIFLTLGLLFIYRLGCFVVLPGVDPLQLSQMVSRRYFRRI
jgi:preprotein translocase subunit SecY